MKKPVNSLMSFIPVLLTLLIFSVSASAQTNEIDSLKKVLKNISANDTLKMITLNKIASVQYSENPSEAIANGNEAARIAAELLNSNNPMLKNSAGAGAADAYYHIANSYNVTGDYQQSITFFEKSYGMAGQFSLNNRKAHAIYGLGTVHYSLGNYDKALEYLLNALNQYEVTGDKQGISYSLIAIGFIHYYQRNYDKAMECYEKSLKLSEEINDLNGIAFSYNKMGILFLEKEDYKKAIEYQEKSLEIRLRLNDKIVQAASWNDLAAVYHLMAFKNSESPESTGNYRKAKECYIKSLELDKEAGNKFGIAASYSNIGTLDTELGLYAEARDYLTKAIEVSEEIGSKENMKACYSGMSDLYKKQGDYKNAFRFQLLFSGIKDSLLNEQTGKQIAEMQTKYESVKKQKEIEMLNMEKELQNIELEKKDAEVKKQNTLKLTFGAGFILVLMLALLIYRGLKQKQKVNLLLARQKQQIEIKNSHLQDANQEITLQKKQLEEKNHEMLSSIRYALRIQEAILPTKKLVTSYLENSFILYKPKDIVAGDFYWMEVVGDQILFAVCDCTGHGVPGAFVSIVAHNALNRAVKEFGIVQPSFILDKVNLLVQETFSKSESDIKDGMDIALCKFQFTGKGASMEYAGANNSIYLTGKGKISEIKADVQPIGKYSRPKQFTNHHIELEKGDTVYAFTDGYADQFGGPKGKKFKYKKFEKLLLSIQDKSMEDQRKILNNTMEDWKGELEQIDDICIIGVKI